MAEIDLSTDNQGVNVSENKIILLNGTALECYPKADQPACIETDEVRLDTTGEYLTIGNKTISHQQKVEDKAKKDEIEELFFKDNAFFFYRNADRILKDSRMFLAPVPVRSGMAYTGSSGFEKPTLGIYIEYWLYSEADVTKDKDGNDALTCHIAGSPLSGRNSCACVYPDGTMKSRSHYPFVPVWRDFIRINKRYSEAKQRYEAYTLQQVWEILMDTEQSEASFLATRLLIQEGRNAVLQRKFDHLKKLYKSLSDKFKEVCIKLRHKELDDFATEYHRREQAANAQLAALDEQRKALRAQMKQNVIDNVEYQKLLRPLHKERDRILLELSSYKYEQINNLIKQGDITYGMVMDYLNVKK